MPGVLFDSSSSSSSSHHPSSEPGFVHPFNAGSPAYVPCSSNGDYETPDLPPSPHSPYFLSHRRSSEPFNSPPLSPSEATRELSQYFRSNLGLLLLNGNDAKLSNGWSLEMSLEHSSLSTPSPRRNLYSTCTDSMVGSPVLSDISAVGSPILSDAYSAFQKFLPSNNDEEVWPVNAFPATDAYSCDDFRMYEFKVRRCMRGRSHDWTECPFAHPGEKARRRDPRRFHYSGTSCPEFRKGSCKRGDACEFAHGVFECWLHPARYRTQPCKDGKACRRKVCFFAHTMEQLRVLPSASAAGAAPVPSPPPPPSSVGISSPSGKGPVTSYDGSPLRQILGSSLLPEATESDVDLLRKSMELNWFNSNAVSATVSASSPTSTLHAHHATSPPPLSPSLSPPCSPPTFPELFSHLPRNVISSPLSPLSNPSSIPSHRRHLNRLHSVPALTIPAAASDLSEAAVYDEFPCGSFMSVSPRNETRETRHAIQEYQLPSRVADLQRANSTPTSPLSHKWSSAQLSPLRQCFYRRVHGIPVAESLWDPTGDIDAEFKCTERVESGRSLRAEIYGKIGKENGVDCNRKTETPDVGWVNELVK